MAKNPKASDVSEETNVPEKLDVESAVQFLLDKTGLQHAYSDHVAAERKLASKRDDH